MLEMYQWCVFVWYLMFGHLYYRPLLNIGFAYTGTSSNDLAPARNMDAAKKLCAGPAQSSPGLLGPAQVSDGRAIPPAWKAIYTWFGSRLPFG